MTTTRVENLPAIWDDARDVPFFRITARLFTPDFCLSATVLLASYDDDAVLAVNSSQNPSVSDAPAPRTTHAADERELLPVRVRRTR